MHAHSEFVKHLLVSVAKIKFFAKIGNFVKFRAVLRHPDRKSDEGKELRFTNSKSKIEINLPFKGT